MLQKTSQQNLFAIVVRNIDIDKAITFNFVKKGSEILIDEFPKIDELDDTKDKIEKI